MKEEREEGCAGAEEEEKGRPWRGGPSGSQGLPGALVGHGSHHMGSTIEGECALWGVTDGPLLSLGLLSLIDRLRVGFCARQWRMKAKGFSAGREQGSQQEGGYSRRVLCHRG